MSRGNERLIQISIIFAIDSCKIEKFDLIIIICRYPFDYGGKYFDFTLGRNIHMMKRYNAYSFVKYTNNIEAVFIFIFAS